jgi:hypothetical protein
LEELDWADWQFLIQSQVLRWPEVVLEFLELPLWTQAKRPGTESKVEEQGLHWKLSCCLNLERPFHQAFYFPQTTSAYVLMLAVNQLLGND